MNVNEKETRFTILQEHILKTLLYFDIFNYPLRSDEIFKFVGIHGVTERNVVNNLHELVTEGVLHCFNDFYSLQKNDQLVSRRIKGNKLAHQSLKIAQKQARLIASFPFVRAVMASGSLSKEYMDENSDLDFFIVTKPGRLWIARTLLVMYKRLFLANSHKYFCVNYFVDQAHLSIDEKNLFTATELATVIPLYNWEAYLQLHQQNGNWLKSFFPNFLPRKKDTVVDYRASKLKTVSEILLGFIGNPLEKACMKLTLRRWERIYKQAYSDTDFKVAFKTNKYASKNHPRHFQRKVMDLYEQKLAEFIRTNDYTWQS